MKETSKQKGLVKDSNKHFRFSPFFTGVLLEAGALLAFVGSVIGLGVTNHQVDKYYNSNDVQAYRQELVLDATEKFNNGDLSEEDYLSEIDDIHSKKNDQKYADVVYADDAEYQALMKNNQNCKKASNVTYVSTLVGFGILGLAAKHLDEENELDAIRGSSTKDENNTTEEEASL